MNTVKIIRKENSAVIINTQETDGKIDIVWARLYVNIRGGIENATATLSSWTGKTVKGAERWAEKKLNQ